MDGRESGTVKAWMEERGMGFITPASGQPDCFVHRSMLTDGQSLVVGSTVSFVQGWDDAKGKPIANQVTGCSPAPGAPGAGGGMGAGQAWSAPAPTPQAGQEVGTVKAWIDGRGMGFITPPDGSADLFVHRSMLADGVSLVVGSQVSYTPGWDAQKNKAIAQNVSGASPNQPAPGPQAGKGGCGGAKGGGGGDNLYISGLPKDSTEESVRGTFGQYGMVTSVKVLPDNGSPDRVALVRMGAPEQAEWLVYNLDGNIPLGLDTVVSVKFHNSGGKGGAAAGGGFQQPAWQQPAWQPQQQWAPPGKGAAPAASAPPGDNLYISGLPADSTTESVTQLLGQYGTITSAKVLDANGKPDAVAMVRMGSVDEAKWMLDNLNGNIPQGIDKVITIKYAQSKPQVAKGFDGGKGGGWGAAPQPWNQGAQKGWSPYGKGGGGAPAPQFVPPPARGPPAKKDKLKISGLPADSTEESIMQLIGQYGAISHIKMMPPTGAPERTAVVQMGDEESAKWLVDTLHGNIPQGITTPVQIVFDNSSQPQGAVAAGGSFAAAGASMTGTVKHWVEDRGMGFITPADGGQDCFVHRSDLMDGLSLVVGAQVSFVTGWDNMKAKPTATQVNGAVGGDGYGKGAAKLAAKGGKGW